MLLLKNSLMKVTKPRPVSGASRKKLIISFKLLLNKKAKRLSSIVRWKSGISRLGRRTVLSKGRKILNSRHSLVSYSRVDNSVHYVSSYLTSRSGNLSALIFSSSGKSFYKRLQSITHLFSLIKSDGVLHNKFSVSPLVSSLTSVSKFTRLYDTLLKIPFLTSVSHLQLSPGKKAKFSRSLGSSAVILRKNNHLSSCVVKLPSGVRKVFSLFSQCSIEPRDNLFIKLMNSPRTKLPHYKGDAPRSRGVAKNPVDHPHGGRTKSIKYPRTPWGKTTKYK